MRAILHGSAGLGLVYLAALATPASAQSLEQQLAHCNGAPGQFAPELVIGGCTWVIQFGHQSAAGTSVAYNNRGYAYVRQRDYPRAIVDFNEAIRLNPQFADAYNNRGLAHINQWDFTRAIADYSEAIRLNPQFADAYYNRGFTYAAQGGYPRAIVDFNEAIRLNPQFRDVYVSRGHAYEMLGDHVRAAADYAEGARLSATGH